MTSWFMDITPKATLVFLKTCEITEMSTQLRKKKSDRNDISIVMIFIKKIIMLVS